MPQGSSAVRPTNGLYLLPFNTFMSATVHCFVINAFKGTMNLICRSHRPRGLRRRSAAARAADIIGSNPNGGMDVCLL